VKRVALIGCGRMGTVLAGHIHRAGHRLVVCDHDASAIGPLVRDGVTSAATPAQAAAGAEVVVTSLPDPVAVEAVVLGAEGVFAGTQGRAVVVDTSTSSPVLAARLAQIGHEQGVDALDAPLSGGPTGANAGTLAVMVGGDAGALERARPVLETFATTICHMGGPGSGQVTKLTNNLLAGCYMAALAEAVALAEQEGLDPTKVYEVWSNGSADAQVLRTRFPVAGVLPGAPVSDDFAAMFPTDLMAKDLDLALAAAAARDVDMPMARAARARFAQVQSADCGALDYSVVAELHRGLGKQ
jgi:3-hydroxyisobutyrate dehydrogenase